jgi:hypothetical protein
MICLIFLIIFVKKRNKNGKSKGVRTGLAKVKFTPVIQDVKINGQTYYQKNGQQIVRVEITSDKYNYFTVPKPPNQNLLYIEGLFPNKSMSILFPVGKDLKYNKVSSDSDGRLNINAPLFCVSDDIILTYEGYPDHPDKITDDKIYGVYQNIIGQCPMEFKIAGNIKISDGNFYDAD